MIDPYAAAPIGQLPIPSDATLTYMNQEEHPKLFVFENPGVRDRYVIRRMGFVDAAAIEVVPLKEQHEIHKEQLVALTTAGVFVPETYSVAPEGINFIAPSSLVDDEYEDVMVVSERIEPVDVSTVDSAVIREQAEGHINGLANYLHASYDMAQNPLSYCMGDAFKPTNIMYGRPHTGRDADFYMIDTGAVMHRTDNGTSDYDLDVAAIMATAIYLTALLDDPQIREYAMQRLDMDQQKLELALRVYYANTGDPNFAAYA